MSNMKKSLIEMNRMKNSITMNDNMMSDRTSILSANVDVNAQYTKGIAITELEKYKVDLIAQLEHSDLLIEQLKKLPYERGDVVFHKTLGVCIVQSIMLGEGLDSSMEANDIVVRVGYMGGSVKVPTTELVLKTDLSESIYGK